jgi:hypothetical protein
MSGISRLRPSNIAVSSTLLGGQSIATPSGITAADTPSLAPA